MELGAKCLGNGQTGEVEYWEEPFRFLSYRALGHAIIIDLLQSKTKTMPWTRRKKIWASFTKEAIRKGRVRRRPRERA